MSRAVPAYRRHKNGQAFIKCVRLNGGKPVYLGKYGSPESRKKYQEIIQRLLLAETAPQCQGVLVPKGEGQPTIAIVVDRYSDFAQKTLSAKEFQEMRLAINPVVNLFATLPGHEFSPSHLVALQEYLLGLGTLCRQTINKRMVRVRRMFRWASKFDHVPRNLYWELKCVDSIPYGRGFEAAPVEPVSFAVVKATLPWLTPVVATMVQTQLLCGMRPQDVCRMRASHITRTDDVWVYAPPKHKMSWRNKPRAIGVPEVVQQLLEPYLDRPGDACLFSPRESYQLLRWQLAKDRGPRKTKLYPCEVRAREQRQAERVATQPAKRARHEGYNTDSYRRAISYAIARAAKHGVTIPHWHPHQLRHSISTLISQSLGEQEAQRWLGHERLETTGIYTQRQLKELTSIARRLNKLWSESPNTIAGCASPLVAAR